MNRILSSLAVALAVGAAAPAQEAAPKPALKVPAELQKARARAAVHNKRVLVVLPEDGQDLAMMIKRDRTVSRTFLYEFETVQLDAAAMADVARPALLVQDTDGKQLVALAEDDFLPGGELAGEQLLAAVKEHFCKPVDAQQKLDAALKVAKKTGQNVLVRFDAPW